MYLSILFLVAGMFLAGLAYYMHALHKEEASRRLADSFHWAEAGQQLRLPIE